MVAIPGRIAPFGGKLYLAGLALAFFSTACGQSPQTLASPPPYTGKTVDASTLASIGTTCRSGGSTQCLAIRYIVFQSPDPTPQASPAFVPVVSQEVILNNLTTINQIWQSCGIQFEIEEFGAVSPEDYGIKSNPSTFTDLDQIRGAFGSNSQLLVVTTDPWDRTGTLGQTSANGWTTLPLAPPYGTILEQVVGDYPFLIAHELGHYLNLLHVSDYLDLMNPLVYSDSVSLSASQCSGAEAAIQAYWTVMLRY
jgi:hypothetical protein